jgi:hypothetical protein
MLTRLARRIARLVRKPTPSATRASIQSYGVHKQSTESQGNRLRCESLLHQQVHGADGPRCLCGATPVARIRACHHDARLRWETDLCQSCWKDAQERANHTELVAIGPPGTNPNGVTV